MPAKPFVMPPLPNQDRIDAAIAKLKAMSVDEFKQTLVNAGVYTTDGQLTPKYRNDDSDDRG